MLKNSEARRQPGSKGIYWRESHYTDSLADFKQAISDAGLEPPDTIEPGKLHRFPGVGKKRGNDAGWCKLFQDGRGGVFGDWSTGLQGHWIAGRSGGDYTPEELAEFRRQVEQAREARDAEDARRRADAARKAARLTAEATPAAADHPYLLRKGIEPVPAILELTTDRVRAILGYTPKSGGEPLAGRILIAPVSVSGELSTAELIDEQGRKSAIAGGRKAGGSWSPEPIPDDAEIVAVGEGVATVLSVRQATGWPVVAALSSGNLEAVAHQVREQHPAAALVILADLVKSTGCPDEHAAEAARAVGGVLAVPQFGAGRQDDHTDFNDMSAECGPAAVCQLLHTSVDNHDAQGEEGQPDDAGGAGGAPDAEADSDEERIRAVAMARTSALKGYSRKSAIRHLSKKFPDLSQHAAKIVEQAFLWFEKYTPGKTVEISGQLKLIASIDDLNRRFAVLDAEDSPAAIVLRVESRPIADRDFLQKVSDQVVMVGIDKKGNPVFKDAGPLWKGDARRHVYRRIDFTRKETPEDTLNLFRGFGVEPKPGTPKLALDHIKEVICSGDKEMAENLVKLMAWQVQNVGKASRVIVLLYSKEQQVGKGIITELLLPKIWGNAGFVALQKDQIAGRFNRHLLGKAYVMLDEALFSGDRAAADLLKGLVVGGKLAIEAKGVDIIQMPSGINVWLNSNHEHAAHIERDDARYSVISVSPHRKGDYEYFHKIAEAIEHGDEANKFLHYLLNLDLTGFIPQRDAVFDTGAKRVMQSESLDPLAPERWLRDCAEAGSIIGMHLDPERPRSGDVDWIEGSLHKGMDLWRAYEEWAGRVKNPRQGTKVRTGQFWAALSDAGIVASERRCERGMRVLASPDEVLKTLRVESIHDLSA